MTDRTSGPAEPVLPRAYYSIGDVCDLTGLKPHVLRYWETQFEALHPTKNRAGNRVYRPREVELILLVKHLLYEEKFTIEGARKRLREMRKDGALVEERQEVAGPELYQIMKEELHALKDVLTLPEPLPEPGSPLPRAGHREGKAPLTPPPPGTPPAGGGGGAPSSPEATRGEGGSTRLERTEAHPDGPLHNDAEGRGGSADGAQDLFPQLHLDVDQG